MTDQQLADLVHRDACVVRPSYTVSRLLFMTLTQHPLPRRSQLCHTHWKSLPGYFLRTHLCWTCEKINYVFSISLSPCRRYSD